MNFYSPQLVEKGRAHMEDIVRHIMHIVSVGGIDCCCFGSDFDGMGTYPRDWKTAQASRGCASCCGRQDFHGRRRKKSPIGTCTGI